MHQSLKKLHLAYTRLETSRAELSRVSAEAQRLAKQSMFSLTRGDETEARERLKQSRQVFERGAMLVKREARLAGEGMWRAALEEYAEAVWLERLARGVFDAPNETLLSDPVVLLGGLSDAVGELVRLAVRAATNGDAKRVAEIQSTAEAAVAFLTSLDLTGSLRSKGDQARQHLRRLEDIVFEMQMRRA